MNWQTGDEVYDFAPKYKKLRVSNRFKIELGLELGWVRFRVRFIVRVCLKRKNIRNNCGNELVTAKQINTIYTGHI